MTRSRELDALAQFVVDLRIGSLPANVIADLRLRLLDGVGVCVAGSRTGVAGQAERLARGWHGEGSVRVLAMGDGFSALGASFLYGVLMESEDFDDSHLESLVHAGCCAVPVALALSAALDLGGGETLSVLAVGYELAIRFGLCAYPGLIHARGFHSTSIAATCAAAAAAARAYGADRDAVADAIGIAACTTAGSMHPVSVGTPLKAMQPALAVARGVQAAQAAMAGVRVPGDALGGPFGMYRLYSASDGWSLGPLVDGLGERWRLLETDAKLYPLCHLVHGYLEAAYELRAATGRSADDVESIVADVSREQVSVLCEPAAAKAAPASLYEGKFSLPFAVAAAYERGARSAVEFAACLEDAAVARLALRTSYRVIDNPDYPSRMPGSLTLVDREGRASRAAFASLPGRFGRAISPDDIVAKYRANVSPVLGGAECERLRGVIDALPIESVGAIAAPSR